MALIYNWKFFQAEWQLASVNPAEKFNPMENKIKKEKIKALVAGMLNESHEAMLKKIDKALNSSAVDIDSWEETYNSMILPKCIVTAILQNESTQYEAKGTSFEEQVQEEVRNIRYFL